jgi:hypothetical protein
MKTIATFALVIALTGCGSADDAPPEGAASQPAPTPVVVRPEPPPINITIPVGPWPYVNPRPVIIPPTR